MTNTQDLIQKLRSLAIGQDAMNSVALSGAADVLAAYEKESEAWSAWREWAAQVDEETERLRRESETWRAWRERALKAEEENRRLRKDAERLSWIERQTLDLLILSHITDALRDGQYYVEGDSANGYGPTLRAAIDAAIAKEKA